MGYELELYVPVLDPEFESSYDVSEEDSIVDRMMLIGYLMQENIELSSLCKNVVFFLKMYKSVIENSWKHSMLKERSENDNKVYIGNNAYCNSGYFSRTCELLIATGTVKVSYENQSLWLEKFNNIIEALDDFESDVLDNIQQKFVDVHKKLETTIETESY